MMKKLLLLIGCFSLLAGCSNIDPYLKKIPFLNKSDFAQENEASKYKEDKTEKPSSDNTEKPTSNDTDQPVLEAAYFNQIKQVNGKKVIQNPENIIALVNKNFALPDDYIPADLVRPNVDFPFGDQKLEKSLLRKEAASALEKMFSNAKESGIELYAVSGYRSYIRQKGLFDAEINHVGKEKAEQAVAVPGQSEHQTGLAMDIAARSTNLNLTEGFGETTEGHWLAENAHKFGFILRYPKGKEGVTVYEYEPWHFRYVGVKAATAIYEKKWTLEEYFNKVKKI